MNAWIISLVIAAAATLAAIAGDALQGRPAARPAADYTKIYKAMRPKEF